MQQVVASHQDRDDMDKRLILIYTAENRGRSHFYLYECFNDINESVVKSDCIDRFSLLTPFKMNNFVGYLAFSAIIIGSKLLFFSI